MRVLTERTVIDIYCYEIDEEQEGEGDKQEALIKIPPFDFLF